MSEALIAIKLNDYAITTPGEDLTMAIKENLGPQGISPFDLDSVKIPAGGSKMWTVPGLEGDEEIKTVIGIPIHYQDRRVYWEKTIDQGGGGQQPDCYSDDMEQGNGLPGGPCNQCPFNEFGSGKDGTGKACKEMRILYILRKDDILPLVFALPPTSIAKLRKFFLRLAGKRIPYYTIEMRLELEEAVSGSNIKYSRLKPSMVCGIEPDAQQLVDKYRAGIIPALESFKAQEIKSEPTTEDQGQTEGQAEMGGEADG